MPRYKHYSYDQTKMIPISYADQILPGSFEEALCYIVDIENLRTRLHKVKTWLKENPDDRQGARKRILKSNVTDNESAKMPTSHGVIQGYTGIAAVDGTHQVIVEAQAHGQAHEAGQMSLFDSEEEGT